MKKKRKKHGSYDFDRLNKYRLKWSQKDEDLLRELYPASFTFELEEHFGRTKEAIRAKALKMGVKKSWRKYDPSLAYDRKRWSKRELKRLKKLYPVMPNDQLVRYFPKRSRDAIGKQANLFGLRKKYLHHFKKPDNYDTKLWREQKDLIIKLYPTTSCKELAEKFGRSEAAIWNQAWKMGLHKADYVPGVRTGTGGRLWTRQDDRLLRTLYPTAWTRELAVRLGRTETAVIARAKLLDVRKDPEKFTPPPRPETWSDEDIKKLRNLWEQGFDKAEIAKQIGKSTASIAGQIQRQARDFGLQTRYRRLPWSKKEDDYLARHYHKKAARQLSAILDRSVNSIHSRAIFLNLSNDIAKSWTNREIAMLKNISKHCQTKQLQNNSAELLLQFKQKPASLG